MSTPSGSTTGLQRIAAELVKLLSTRSLRDVRRLLVDNPELLSDVALTLLAALKRQIKDSVESGEAELIERNQRLIKRSREVGVDAAVQEATSGMLRSPLLDLWEEATAVAGPVADPAGVNDLIRRLVDAVARSPDAPPETRAALLYQAGRLSLLLEQERDDGHRDRAIDLLRRGVAVSPLDTPIRTRCLSMLASALMEQYRDTHQASALDEAVSTFDAVRGSTRPSEPDWEAVSLSNHASALLDRYLRDGRVEDLDRATEIALESLQAAERATPEFAVRLVNLGALLTYRYRRTGMLSDLDSAVEAIAMAVREDLPVENMAAARTILGNALRERYSVSGNADDLQSAMDEYEQALDLTPVNSPSYRNYLSNLGALYSERFHLTRDPHDLDRAVDLGRQALEAAPEGIPEHVSWLGNLAYALKLRYEVLQHAADRKAAIDAYRHAVALGRSLQSAVSVLIAAQWGGWASARGSWPEASEAYGHALSILDQFLRRSSWRDREGYLAATTGLTEDAAYALVHDRRAREAVVMLETGRTRLLDEALARYAPEIEDLSRAGHDELVMKFRDAVRLNLTAELKPSDQAAGTSQHKTLADLTIGIEAGGGVQNLESLLTVNYDRLRRAAAQTPLIYIAPAREGGLALVVRESPGEPQDLWLPQLTEDELRHRLTDYMAAYDRRSSGPEQWISEVDMMLQWLWDAVMGPLVAELQERRAVLVPMGLLTMLPLHAAWARDGSAPGGRRYVLDSHLLTYACNARSLPRVLGHVGGSEQRFVMVKRSSRSRSGDTLPGVEVAPDTLRRWFGHVTELPGEDAGRHGVFDALKSHDVAHFACPIRTDLVDPLITCLSIGNDERLTVRSLITGPDVQVRIAIVAAGQSALPGAQLPNEVISIPTGLHAAGVPTVVGCLWEVGDLAARILMERFYATWLARQLEPRAALREAQLWMRDASAKELEEVGAPGPWNQPASRGSARVEDYQPFAAPVHWAGWVYSGA